MPLILSMDCLILSQWWVDAVYTVHHNCKGHTGTGMNFVQVMTVLFMEAEADLVGVDDTLGYILRA